MEKRKINGKQQTMAIHISLNENGKFEAVESNEKIILKGDLTKATESSAEETTKKKQKIAGLSNEKLRNVKKEIKKYYVSMQKEQKIVSIEQVENRKDYMNENDSRFKEIVTFEVFTVESEDVPRYILLGSNDDWKTCEVLNEGY